VKNKKKGNKKVNEITKKINSTNISKPERKKNDEWSLGELEKDFVLDEPLETKKDDQVSLGQDAEHSILGGIIKVILILFCAVLGTAYIVYWNTEQKKSFLAKNINILTVQDEISNETEQADYNPPQAELDLNFLDELIQNHKTEKIQPPQLVVQTSSESSSSLKEIQQSEFSSSSELIVSVSSITSKALASSVKTSSSLSSSSSLMLFSLSSASKSSKSSKNSLAKSSSSLSSKAISSSSIAVVKSASLSSLPDFSSIKVKGNVKLFSASERAVNFDQGIQKTEINGLKWSVTLSTNENITDQGFLGYLKTQTVLGLVEDDSLRIIDSFIPQTGKYVVDNDFKTVQLNGDFATLTDLNLIKDGSYSLILSINKTVISSSRLIISVPEKNAAVNLVTEISSVQSSSVLNVPQEQDIIVQPRLSYVIHEEESSIASKPQQPVELYTGAANLVNSYGGKISRSIVLNVRFEDLDIEGEANVSGIGIMAVKGKLYERGFEMILTGDGQHIKLTGVKRNTMLRGRFVSGSLNETGSWEVMR
jgi:hypothetical protein